MEQPRQPLLGRILADIRANPGVWVGVGIAVLILIVGVIAYRNNQANGAATATPADAATGTTSGQPLWSTASLGSDPGGTPSASEMQAEIDAITAYLQSNQTPNPSGTASPIGSSGSSGSSSVATPAAAVQALIARVTTPATPATPVAPAAVVTPTVSPAPPLGVNDPYGVGTQTPQAASQLAHRGVVSAPAPVIHPATASFIPTTLQPTNSGHGRQP